MTTKRARSLTAMSCFLVLASISGCMRIETTDGSSGGGGNHVLPDAYVPATSLAGSIACGSFTCGPQTMCTEQYGGLDAGLGYDAGGTPSGPTYSCTPVPTSCHVFDCSSETCSQCIRDLCYYGASYGVYVTGRYLTCPGV
jgi:hypothetical protein